MEKNVEMTGQESAALAAAAAVILESKDPHPEAIAQLHLLESAGEKLCRAMGRDWSALRKEVRKRSA